MGGHEEASNRHHYQMLGPKITTNEIKCGKKYRKKNVCVEERIRILHVLSVFLRCAKQEGRDFTGSVNIAWIPRRALPNQHRHLAIIRYDDDVCSGPEKEV